ncbi:DNA double-strand break repair nuclease NurA [Candidatus Cyanaurora vandensis]|nr:DNA double-strand break repair nuclease NurA [Candidatus Cyanaurora vandensis]
MLDFLKLNQQMKGVGNQLQAESKAMQHRLRRAQHLLTALAQDPTTIPSLAGVGFLVGEPVEPLQVDGYWGRPVTPIPRQHRVLATDGSQIKPSHHEIAYCFLINVGRVCLYYGTGQRARLDSMPELFYKEEDLYGPQQLGLNIEEWLAIQRSRAELRVLADLAQDPCPLPTVALVDGSLIYWQLEQIPQLYQPQVLDSFLAHWERLREARVPMAGYISASRASETVNLLRITACPHQPPDCEKHCPGLKPRATACGQGLSPLTDSRLWETLLQPGERSALWRSTSRILGLYGPHGVYFCYLHVGDEVARIEFPAWVAQDDTLLEQVLGCALD